MQIAGPLHSHRVTTVRFPWGENALTRRVPGSRHERVGYIRKDEMKVGLLALLAILVAALLVSAAVGSGSGSGSSEAGPGKAAGGPRTSARHAHGLTSTAATRQATARTLSTAQRFPSPGSLPQTHVFPSGAGARFTALMASLWTGIVGGRVAPALVAFFPRGAYVQLKEVASASSDWSERLVHDYALDITAAHELLGRDAATARLLAVSVPASYGHWVPPGTCYNRVGYYEVPNARVVYSEHGQVRSFGIASLISWRGVWYVVHLGAILRPSDSGTVDEPASGRGSSLYSGTC